MAVPAPQQRDSKITFRTILNNVTLLSVLLVVRPH